MPVGGTWASLTKIASSNSKRCIYHRLHKYKWIEYTIDYHYCDFWRCTVLCSAFVIIQHTFSQWCNLIYKMRLTADPDRSTNKLIGPMKCSTDLWIRTENNCSTSHIVQLNLNNLSHIMIGWCIYMTTAVGELCNVLKYLIYGFLIKSSH